MMILKLALFLKTAESWLIIKTGLGVGARSEIWEQELVRYPEWPRALVLSQRAV